MSTTEIIKEIEKLSVTGKLLFIEQTLKKIRSAAFYDQMTFAAEDLANEYRTNKELTIFSNLDLEDFYETR